MEPPIGKKVQEIQIAKIGERTRARFRNGSLLPLQFPCGWAASRAFLNY